MKKSTIADNSLSHVTSSKQYLLNQRTNSSTLHPRSTAERLRTFARSFMQKDCEVSNKYQAKESETQTCLHLERALINENPNAYSGSIIKHVSIEINVEHLPVNATNLELDAGLNVKKKWTHGPTVGHEWAKRRQNHPETKF